MNLPELKTELREIIKSKPRIDYITISGSGEPTLHKDLDKIIGDIRKVTGNKYPVCVITNSSLLYRRDVRQELKKADLIIPSLDAADSGTFHKINKPYKGLTFDKIVNGLLKLRKEFNGKIWLEIMLVGGVNDSLGEARKFREFIRKIRPDNVQLNIPVRPAGPKMILPFPERVEEIKSIIGGNVEVVSVFRAGIKTKRAIRNLKEEILNFLKRRPASLEDLVNFLFVDTESINKQLNFLLKNKYIKKMNKHFVIDD